MKTRSLRLSLVHTLTALCFLGSNAKASIIFWGNLFNDNLYTSSGNPLDASFTFEIGMFDTTGGWAPTSANLSEWLGRWMVFDRRDENNGWLPGDQFFEGDVDHTVTGGSSSPAANATHVFPEGAQAYLWVYDTQDFVQGAEWALLADFNKGSNIFPGAWEFPDPSLPNSEGFDWQVRDLDTAIFGGVNNVQGAGQYVVNPGIFSIQTHVVPEPGSALMLVGAGLCLMRRRRPRVG